MKHVTCLIYVKELSNHIQGKLHAWSSLLISDYYLLQVDDICSAENF